MSFAMRALGDNAPHVDLLITMDVAAAHFRVESRPKTAGDPLVAEKLLVGAYVGECGNVLGVGIASVLTNAEGEVECGASSAARQDGPQSRPGRLAISHQIRCRNSERLSVTMDAAVAIPS